MRIAQINKRYSIAGGSEKTMRRCAEGLREVGHDVLIIHSEGEITPGGPAGSLPLYSRGGSGAAAARPSLITVIPAWEEALYLRDTVEALRGAAKIFPRADLIIVASAGDGTLNVARDAARAYDLGETWVIEQRPLGKMQALADGIDIVARSPAPDYLLLLDADTQLDPGALAAAREFLEGRHDLAGVGPVHTGYISGIGAARDDVELALLARERSLPVIAGVGMFLRGALLWPHLSFIFGPHDYPTQIDTQICERIGAAVGKPFAYAPRYWARTEIGRGSSYVAGRRRHFRGMFARGGVHANWRMLGGNIRDFLLPLLAPAAFLPLVRAEFWLVSLAYFLIAGRTIWRLHRRYRFAVRSNLVPIDGPFAAYVVDSWFGSFGGALAAFDVFIRRRNEGVHFKGSRRLV